MLIRSQDKTALVKFENIVVNLKLPDSLNVICWSLQDAQRSGGYFILGTYSTKAKVMKVLDMIQEAYGDSEYTKYVIPEVCRILSMKPKTEENKAHAGELGEMLKKGMTFQMPEDSEVEA
jgi:nucleoside-diphosphate-sugar epimerase